MTRTTSLGRCDAAVYHGGRLTAWIKPTAFYQMTSWQSSKDSIVGTVSYRGQLDIEYIPISAIKINHDILLFTPTRAFGIMITKVVASCSTGDEINELKGVGMNMRQSEKILKQGWVLMSLFTTVMAQGVGAISNINFYLASS